MTFQMDTWMQDVRFRSSLLRKESVVYAGRPVVPRHRHWREHVNLQCSQRALAPSPAL